MPKPGLLFDGRAATTFDEAVNVSPGWTDRWKLQSSRPRNGPPASLRSSTERPTTVHSTSIGLTTTSRWPWARAYSALRCIGFQLQVAVEKSELSPSVIVRPQW